MDENSLSLLTEISDGDISNVNVDRTKEQLGSFLLMQAQRELKQVISLTRTLDVLQEKYQDKVIQYIEDNDDETAIAYLPIMIDNISKCIDRSTAIITKVMADKNITNLMIVDASNRSINLTNNNDIRSGIQDPVSRARIREAVDKILNSINDSQQT